MENMELMERRDPLPGEGERLNVLGAEIRVLKGQAQQMALGYAVEIGRRLTEAKAMVPHGEWGAWLEREVEYSQSTAQNLMRVYRECGDEQASLFGPSKAQALGGLSYTKVLQILTIPEGPERDEFLADNDVASMSTRELDAAIKARDEALAAAEQARADQRTADEAREKLSQEMSLAKARLEELNAGLERQADAAQKAREEADRLAAELEELRARPVDVAVETDAAAVETARREAEEKMRSKLDKAKKAQAKAEEKRKAAEEALKQAQADLEQVKAEGQAALEKAVAEGQAVLERAEKAEKKAALASNEDLMLFRTLFDQVQEQVNKLGGVLMKVRSKDPEAAERLGRAMLALAEKMKGAAGNG